MYNQNDFFSVVKIRRVCFFSIQLWARFLLNDNGPVKMHRETCSPFKSVYSSPSTGGSGFGRPTTRNSKTAQILSCKFKANSKSSDCVTS